jgi:D-glycero-D-manno-heptose 1,7-bisphosphate phosphatase
MSKRKVVFLDRDGTLNRDIGYPARFEQIHLYPEAPAAVRKINEAGFAAVVITHQSGVGRGYFTEADLAVLHRRFEEALANEGARLDGIYSCPHDPRSREARPSRDCACRKPLPGLALRAAADLALDLAGCAMIGDKPDDVLLGRAIGARSVLVLTGYGQNSRRILELGDQPPDFVAPGVLQAVAWILGGAKGG